MCATRNYADRLGPAGAGENRSAPTNQGGKNPNPGLVYHPAPLWRGGVEVAPRVGPDGVPLETAGYGRNGNAVPSSVGVAQSGGSDGLGLADAPLVAPDATRARLA